MPVKNTPYLSLRGKVEVSDNVRIFGKIDSVIMAPHYITIFPTGPPERISCALGTVCGHENSWRLSIDWHWDEGGQSSTIATTTSSGSTTPTPSPAGVTWSNWYDDGEEDPYESDGDWDAYNPDHGHRRRRRELPAKVIGASRNEQRINQIRKESVHSRHRRDEAVDPIVSAYISTAPHVVHLVSPNYPNNYTDRLDGACHIQTMAGSSLDLTVLRFHMEHHDICEFDWLHIETPWHSHKLCDTILPGSKEALNTDWARVMFHSDAWIMDTGFLISFTGKQNFVNQLPRGKNVLKNIVFKSNKDKSKLYIWWLYRSHDRLI